MNDLTLESLAKRVEALEKVIATKEPDQPRKDWRKVVGMFRDSEFMRKVEIVPFDEAAARQFDDLRRQKLRIRSRDLKIAATALVNGALLLSANRTDFERVPGLRVENWLD
jgi:predicted nucleic acid-binding protein